MKKELSMEAYMEGALLTESCDFEAIAERLSDPKMIRLLHAAIGIATESGEILDALKKHIFYGKELDETNLFEEAGDNQWYVAILLDALNKTIGEAFFTNNAKLMSRYQDGTFTEKHAITRDLSKERDVLEET